MSLKPVYESKNVLFLKEKPKEKHGSKGTPINNKHLGGSSTSKKDNAEKCQMSSMWKFRPHQEVLSCKAQ